MNLYATTEGTAIYSCRFQLSGVHGFGTLPIVLLGLASHAFHCSVVKKNVRLGPETDGQPASKCLR
jgi:hypothetical protein